MKKKELEALLQKMDPVYYNAPKWVKHCRANGINVVPGAWLGKEKENGQG